MLQEKRKEMSDLVERENLLNKRMLEDEAEMKNLLARKNALSVEIENLVREEEKK